MYNKANLLKSVNDICERALSCIRKLLSIFFCITILSKSSILLTIPVTFIYSKSPLILNCDTIIGDLWEFILLEFTYEIKCDTMKINKT